MPRLITIPALIDPHVHFRTPGGEHKEDWVSGTRAALSGGVSMVFDMPNTNPATTSLELVLEKKRLITESLKNSNQSIRYGIYLGATNTNVREINIAKPEIIGVKLFMGASTGNLQMTDENAQAEFFQECARLDLPLAIHAEDEATLQKAKADFVGVPTVSDHGKLRPREAAIIALERAIQFAEKYKTKVYSLHTSTKEEVELIRSAKKLGITIFAEVTPHHIFLNETDLEYLGNLGKMNPPLRTTVDQASLWDGIHDGAIDTIGTDHAPHTHAEKSAPYTEAPSGVPGVETYLALLLNAHTNGKISLNEITKLTRINIQKIFNLTDNNDTVTVDLDLIRTIKNQDIISKCQWSPFADQTLTGWPIKTNLE